METKVCVGCNIEKPIGEFHTRARKTTTYVFPKCKECHRSYTRGHYEANKGDYLTRVRARQVELTRTTREFLISYLRDHPCVDCSEGDPVVLQFDHCRGEKVANISDMVRRGWSLRTIKLEIEKCDVVCANCHQRRTARQFGWWNLAL
ncbi:hypothetical protein GCM10023176_54400 [Micromonospora coerulea]|uniref:HNH endonuclease n=1 Tax=Micromonospora coerulea TaxID=47856 RepID=A0ABP8T2D9_9ACTN